MVYCYIIYTSILCVLSLCHLFHANCIVCILQKLETWAFENKYRRHANDIWSEWESSVYDYTLCMGGGCGGRNHYLCVGERVLEERREPRQQGEEGARCAEVCDDHRTNEVGRDREDMKRGTFILPPRGGV